MGDYSAISRGHSYLSASLDHNASDEQLRPYDALEDKSAGPRRVRIKGAYRDLLTAFAFATFPMIILPGILLGLIFRYQISASDGLSPDLGNGLQLEADSSAYFVEYSATILVTVASWASSVAPIMSRFAMTLFSYPAAYQILKKSAAGKTSDLPTPSQLSLYLNLQTGSVLALWDCLRYRFANSRGRFVPAVRIMLWGLFTTALIRCVLTLDVTLMARYMTKINAYTDLESSVLIVGADTWLHVTTETVTFTNILPPGSGSQNYGRGLTDSCLTMNVEGLFGTTSCLVYSSATNVFLTNATDAFQTINNISSSNTISSFEQDGTTFVYLAPTNLPDDFDFQASTIGVSSQCTIASEQCNLRVDSGAALLYNCSESFAGNALEEANLYIPMYLNRTYFQGPDLKQLFAPTQTTGPTIYEANPFYSAELGVLTSVENTFSDQPEVVTPMHGGISWILKCNTTIYDITYSWVNATVQAPNVTVANGTLGGIMISPLFEQAFPLVDLTAAAQAASLSNTTAELEDRYAQSLARETLGLSAYAFEPRETLQGQGRESILVARIPKVPLYILVALNLLYATVGIVITLVALASDPRQTRDVQARLSVAGVTAACYEDPQWMQRGVVKVDDLFQENSGQGLKRRVKVVRVPAGGWSHEITR